MCYFVKSDRAVFQGEEKGIGKQICQRVHTINSVRWKPARGESLDVLSGWDATNRDCGFGGGGAQNRDHTGPQAETLGTEMFPVVRVTGPSV